MPETLKPVWRNDAFAFALTALICFVIGFAIFDKRGPGNFYQRHFLPAVMLACTGELRNLEFGPKSDEGSRNAFKNLNGFLHGKQSGFDCRDLSRLDKVRDKAFDPTTGSMFYLLSLSGKIWSVVGVDWRQLAYIAAILNGLLGLALFGLFRSVAGRWGAVGFTILICLSPGFLDELTNLRDFAKAPFLIGGVALAVAVALGPFELRYRLVLAAIAGSILGVGYGIRADILLVLPLFVLTVVVFGDFRGKSRLLASTALIFVFGLSFLAVATPVIQALGARGGGALFHVALLGTADDFNAPLGVDGASYSILYQYNDALTYGFVDAFAAPYTFSPLHFLSNEYGHWAAHLYGSWLVNFPADFLVRVFGAMIQVLDVPTLHSPYDLGFADRIRDTLTMIDGRLLFVIALTVLAVRRYRYALLFLFIAAYFGATSAIQFQSRHVFHLETIYWFSAAAVIAGVMRLFLDLRNDPTVSGTALRIGLRAGVARALIFVAGLAIAVSTCAVVLSGLRSSQERHLTRLFERIGSLPRVPLPFRAEDVPGNMVLVRPVAKIKDLRGQELRLGESKIPSAPGPGVGDGQLQAAVLVVTFSASEPGCSGKNFLARIRYRYSDKFFDFSRLVEVWFGSKQAVKNVVFPVFVNPTTYFEGILLPRSSVECLKEVAVVNDVPRDVPLIGISLPSQLNSLRLFQKFHFERNYFLADRQPQVQVVRDQSSDLVPKGELDPLAVRKLLPSDFEWTNSDIARTMDNGEVVVTGRAAARSSYVVVSKTLELEAGDVLIASGELSKGGVQVGLIWDTDKTWANQVTTRRPGEFSLRVTVPKTAKYQVVLAHYLPTTRPVDFRLHQFGIVAADATR